MVQKNDLVTKPYLRSYLREELDRFGKRLKQELKGDLIEIKTEIVKEIRDMREEFDVHQASHIRINEELEDHEERIGKLEQV